MKFTSMRHWLIGSEEDRFAVWPLATAIGFGLALILVWAGPFGLAFLGVPLLLLLWAATVLVASIAIAFALRGHKWRRAISVSILPIFTLAAGLDANPLLVFAIDTGDRIHFRLMRSHYADQVSEIAADRGPRLAIFDWGGFVVSHAVVYDESDEIVMPVVQQSAAWKKRIAGTELECGAWGTSLGQHFYLVRIGC